MGNVISAGIGQCPARQAAIKAGIPFDASCCTVNKVCASGMKALQMAMDEIYRKSKKSKRDVICVAGGFESMSNTVKTSKGVNLMVKDGLICPFSGVHMGIIACNTADKEEISRKEQDDYADLSYKRSIGAHELHKKYEIVPISIPDTDTVVDYDEEPLRYDPVKMRQLKPVFRREVGTITAANASTLADGACSFVIASRSVCIKRGLSPIATLRSFTEVGVHPSRYIQAPIPAVKELLEEEDLIQDDIDLWEINEAFAIAPLIFCKHTGIDSKIVNIHGGAVSLGHPLGCSGARIVLSLISSLRAQAEEGKKRSGMGVASACCGGGEGMAVLVQLEK
eukprot:gnl/Carplike_NY0171/7040_a9717_158.p1 GENE.gnl/Carplike_NY0171/7040_a9717_158~~gnl/Carplike_NY0171/7040_a9717_158.p1  ORF type:complete len:361 (-),score=82.65 gnl/Carplike_NY0171/7040_a9717_158:775-1788(-)